MADPNMPQNPLTPPGVPGGASPAMPPPPEAGMLTPQKNAGDEAMADVNVRIAMDVLTSQLPIYGPGSAKGQCLLDVLKKLSKDFGELDQAKPLQAAEIQQLLSQVPGGSPNLPVAGGPPVPPMMQ